MLGAVLWWRWALDGADLWRAWATAWSLRALLIPTRLGPVNRAWMELAHLISRVTTPIFMGVVYFLVLAPIGLLMRTFGRNPMVAPDKDGSFWAIRSPAEQRAA